MSTTKESWKKIAEEEALIHVGYMEQAIKRNSDKGRAKEINDLFIALDYQDVKRFCDMDGEKQGAAIIRKVVQKLTEARQCVWYEQVEDSFDVYSFLQETNEICQSADKIGIKKTTQRLEEMENRLEKMSTPVLLKYLVDVYRFVWEEDDSNWAIYRLKTMFA